MTTDDMLMILMYDPYDRHLQINMLELDLSNLDMCDQYIQNLNRKNLTPANFILNLEGGISLVDRNLQWIKFAFGIRVPRDTVAFATIETPHREPPCIYAACSDFEKYMQSQFPIVELLSNMHDLKNLMPLASNVILQRAVLKDGRLPQADQFNGQFPPKTVVIIHQINDQLTKELKN